MSMHEVPPPPPYGGPPGPNPAGPYAPGPYPPGPYVPGPPVQRSSRLGKSTIAALVMAVLGFVEISFWSSRSVNGVMVECSYTNLAPLMFGPPAVILGLVAVVRGRRTEQAGSRAWQLGLLAVGLGALHLLRAAGAVTLDVLGSGSPC